MPVLDELSPLTERFAAAGHHLYLVGGTVRDLLVADGTDTNDFDATTSARPADIKRCLDGWADAIWTQGERFGTIGAKKDERIYEITTHRAEAYNDDSRKPHVEFADDIETDLSRRDFTVNSMALELTAATPTLVDPFGGATDLVTRTLRTPLSPEVSFSDDPLRMLRAARFIARYQLQPVPELDRGCHGDAQPVGDRVRRAHPRRARQAHHGRSSQRWDCGSRSRRVWPTSSCRSSRRCDSNRTRSTDTKMS